MTRLKEYYEAWRATKSDELKIKLDIDWIGLALAVIFVMYFYKEWFKP